MTPQDLRLARWLLGIVAIGLFLSGVTVFPARQELEWLIQSNLLESFPNLKEWLNICAVGLRETGDRFPFLFYAGDWLAFAHIMLAILFLGAIPDPIRNIWVIQFGLTCCAAVIPFAFFFSWFRGLPWYWGFIDSSFGVAGGALLFVAHRLARKGCS